VASISTEPTARCGADGDRPSLPPWRAARSLRSSWCRLVRAVSWPCGAVALHVDAPTGAARERDSTNRHRV